MKIIIEVKPKEIAALVLAVQEQQTYSTAHIANAKVVDGVLYARKKYGKHYKKVTC